MYFTKGTSPGWIWADERRKSYMTKTHWRPSERQRLLLDGEVTGWVRQQMEKINNLVIFEGPFGAGKTTQLIRLFANNDLLPVPKIVLRSPQPLEQNSAKWLVESTSFKGLTTDDSFPAIFALGAGLYPPYEEWNYWGDRLNMASPGLDEVWKIDPIIGAKPSESFLAAFRLKDFAQMVEIAFHMKIPALGLTMSPLDARDIVEILSQFCPDLPARTVSFYLDCPVEQRTSRILQRIREQYNTSSPERSFYARMKILEGASMPELPETNYPVYRISNSDSDNPYDVMKQICSILRYRPFGGGPSRHRKNYGINFYLYASLCQLFKR